MARLARMFEPAVLEAWFKNSRFDEGPPLTLVLDGRMQCNWVRDRFGDRLRCAFGDDLAFSFQRERVRGDADA
jgi:hypothetical protein